MLSLRELRPRLHKTFSRVETWPVVDGDPATWRERGCPTKSHAGPRYYFEPTDSIIEADGLMFLCPLCYWRVRDKVLDALHGTTGDITIETVEALGLGAHLVWVSFANRGLADDAGTRGASGTPSRWSVSGSSFDDIALNPSILVSHPCGWHGFIENGQIVRSNHGS